MQPRVAVLVGNFVYPPTTSFVNVIRKTLAENFENHQTYVVTNDTHEEPLMTQDTISWVRYTMERTEKLMRERPENILTASVLPFQIEFTVGSRSVGKQSMVFIAVRNERGKEWVYAHFVGRITSPVAVTHMLADTVDQVLEERGSLIANVAQGKIERVTSFIEMLRSSVDFVLANGTKQRTLNS